MYQQEAGLRHLRFRDAQGCVSINTQPVEPGMQLPRPNYFPLDNDVPLCEALKYNPLYLYFLLSQIICLSDNIRPWKCNFLN